MAFLAPVGCSLGGDEEPQPVAGAPKAIVATVDRLREAIAERDWATICRRLFTDSARRRAGGRDCTAQLRASGEDVRKPALRIEKIDVSGDRASVEVATTAEGQSRVRDTLRLRRERGRWLVEALG